MDKRKVAEILYEIKQMLELKGENHFKVRAYENAARIIETLDEDLGTLVKENRLGDIKGVGKAIQAKIEELLATGHLAYYEELKKSFPDTIFDLLRIPGLGPKKVRALYNQLNIDTLDKLETACLKNRLLELPGFGIKTQENILKGIDYLKSYQGRFLFSEAYAWGSALLEKILSHPDVIQAALAGSLRRRKETIKDIDLLAATVNTEKVMDFFTTLPGVIDIIGKGDTKSSVRLENGITADLRVVANHEIPYALHHFTGSKEHNTAMRHRAKEMGIKMNEYGLFKGEEQSLIECSSEEEVFKALGMQYIPPELRENLGEIEAAAEGKLPKLVEEEDLKGIIHVHSYYSDGENSIHDLAKEAQRLGYHYMGIADHSQSAFYAQGMREAEVKKQHLEIDELNRAMKGFKIFKGIEADIMADGTLDYQDEILKSFDFVIASVHSRFGMGREEMTQRIVKALDNPYVTILGHPTGRLLLSREEYAVDLEQVLQRAAKRGVAIEINANPHRLDLDWIWCKRAKDLGCKLIICPDAHSLQGFKDTFYGVGVARKGWLEKKDILNCLDMQQFEAYLKTRRGSILH